MLFNIFFLYLDIHFLYLDIQYQCSELRYQFVQYRYSIFNIDIFEIDIRYIENIDVVKNIDSSNLYHDMSISVISAHH